MYPTLIAWTNSLIVDGSPPLLYVPRRFRGARPSYYDEGLLSKIPPIDHHVTSGESSRNYVCVTLLEWPPRPSALRRWTRDPASRVRFPLIWLSVHSEKGRTPRGDVPAGKATKNLQSHRSKVAVLDACYLSGFSTQANNQPKTIGFRWSHISLFCLESKLAPELEVEQSSDEVLPEAPLLFRQVRQ